MDAASLAVADQYSAGYGVDTWFNVTLQPMLKLWQGEWPPEGEPGCYFFSEQDAREATGAYAGTKPYRFAETLWRLAQVRSHAVLGFRRAIFEFVVDLPVVAAVGVCSANVAYGSGSVFQYFLPGGENQLLRTGRAFHFGALAYSG